MPLLFLLACTPGSTPKPEDSAATPAPTGDSREDAVPVDDATGTTPMHDAVDPVGDVDWYAVDLAAGEYLRIQTVSVEGDPAAADFECNGLYDDDPIDAVALVYDPDGAQVAAIDSWSGFACGNDGIGMVRAEQAGTWTVEVTDWGNWEEGGGLFGSDPVGGPDYTYDLYTAIVSPDAAPTTLGDTPVLTEGDPTLTVTVTEPAWVSLYHAIGTNADIEDMTLELLDSDGERVAYTDADALYGVYWGLGLLYPAARGTYTLRGAGSDWYWLWAEADTASADNPEVEPDDDVASATPFETRSGDGEYAGDYVQAQVSGLITAGDVDTFSVSVEEGQYVYVRLQTGEVGSALSPTMTLFGVDGVTALASDAADIDARRMPDTGTVTLSIAGGDSNGYYLAYLQVWDSRRPW
jgi:hypothetical protein